MTLRCMKARDRQDEASVRALGEGPWQQWGAPMSTGASWPKEGEVHAHAKLRVRCYTEGVP